MHLESRIPQHKHTYDCNSDKYSWHKVRRLLSGAAFLVLHTSILVCRLQYIKLWTDWGAKSIIIAAWQHGLKWAQLRITSGLLKVLIIWHYWYMHPQNNARTLQTYTESLPSSFKLPKKKKLWCARYAVNEVIKSDVSGCTCSRQYVECTFFLLFQHCQSAQCTFRWRALYLKQLIVPIGAVRIQHGRHMAWHSNAIVTNQP